MAKGLVVRAVRVQGLGFCDGYGSVLIKSLQRHVSSFAVCLEVRPHSKPHTLKLNTPTCPCRQGPSKIASRFEAGSYAEGSVCGLGRVFGTALSVPVLLIVTASVNCVEFLSSKLAIS